MDKWGLGYEELRKINPRIIYMQTTGMGKAGVYKDYVSYGPTAQAFSGLTFLSGLPEPRPPAGWGYSYLDHSPGYFGAIMLMAAIRRQRVDGTGCYIDMSQCETGFMLSGTSIVEHQITGKPTARYGNRMPFLDWSPHGAYRCTGERQLDRALDSIRRAVARADRGDGLARNGRSMRVSRAPLRASSTRTNSMRGSPPSPSDASATI